MSAEFTLYFGFFFYLFFAVVIILNLVGLYKIIRLLESINLSIKKNEEKK